MTQAILVLTNRRNELAEQEADLSKQLRNLTERHNAVSASIAEIDAAIAKLKGEPPELPPGLPPDKCREIVRNAVAAAKADPAPRKVPARAAGGRKGGPARASALTPERRREIARMGAATRFGEVPDYSALIQHALRQSGGGMGTAEIARAIKWSTSKEDRPKLQVRLSQMKKRGVLVYEDKKYRLAEGGAL